MELFSLHLGSVFIVLWIAIAQVWQLPLKSDCGFSLRLLTQELLAQMQIRQYPKHCLINTLFSTLKVSNAGISKQDDVSLESLSLNLKTYIQIS